MILGLDSRSPQEGGDVTPPPLPRAWGAGRHVTLVVVFLPPGDRPLQRQERRSGLSNKNQTVPAQGTNKYGVFTPACPTCDRGCAKPEGSHHGMPEDAPQCTKNVDLAPIGPNLPQPSRANTATPRRGAPNYVDFRDRWGTQKSFFSYDTGRTPGAVPHPKNCLRTGPRR